MYDLDNVKDYDRYLFDWFTANPETKVNEDGAVVNPKFDENGVFVGGDKFTPDESIARLKVSFSKSWPDGVENPPVVDPISQYAHFWINYQRGWDIKGNKITDAIQSQPTPAGQEPWTIQGGPVKVNFVDEVLHAKVDELINKVDNLTMLNK